MFEKKLVREFIELMSSERPSFFYKWSVNLNKIHMSSELHISR